MYLSGEVLVESRFARDRQIAEIPSEQAQEVLNRAEALIFSVWRSPDESQHILFREPHSAQKDVQSLRLIGQRWKLVVYRRLRTCVFTSRRLRWKFSKDFERVRSKFGRSVFLTIESS
jgi:hypothetical protein